MPFGWIDDKYYDHDKVMALPREIRNACCGLRDRAISYANAKLTDGFVSRAVLDMLDATDEVVEAMATVQPGQTSGMLIEVEGGYRIHNFHKYSKTRERVLADREKRSQAGRAGGLASGRRRSKKPSTTGATTAPTIEEANRSSLLRTPTNPVTDTVSVQEKTPPPPAERGRREFGTSPRQRRVAPRDTGTDPRTQGTSPRRIRQAQKTGPTQLGFIMAEVAKAAAGGEGR